MTTPKPVRIVPVYRNGQGHGRDPDGWIVAPEDRAVREVEIEKPKRPKKTRR